MKPAGITDLEELADECARWQVPGLQVVAAARGEVLIAGGVGVRGVEDPAPVGAQTVFHHGSCGKAYTGLLAALLAEEGELDLDAPVRRYVPELELPDPAVADQVTTRDLLTHSSGLGRHDLAWILNPTWTRDHVVRRLAHLPLAGGLRERWRYSNLGYTLAGYVIERATGKCWEEQLAGRVLVPLGMTRTFTRVAEAHHDSDHAQAHLLRDGVAVPTPTRALGAVAPAGGVLSCAEDAARWLLLHTGALPSASAATRAAVEVTGRPMAPLPATTAAPLPELAFKGYGFGWLAGTYRDHPVRWHNGGVDGFLTQTLVLPEEGIGILVSANLHMTDLAFAALLHTTDRLLAVAGDSWFDRLRPDDAPDPQPEPPRPAGTYRHPGFGTVVVAGDAGALAVRVGECELAVEGRPGGGIELVHPVLDVRVGMAFLGAADGAAAFAVLDLVPGETPVCFARIEEAGGS
ncbi:MAG: serine hydrolase domain-containing protein [Mycobacteriales bacterium]